MAYWTHTGMVESAPAIEPVRVDEFPAFARVDLNDDGDLIDAFLVAGRERVEAMTGRALISRQVVAYFDDWPENEPDFIGARRYPRAYDLRGYLRLPRSPVTAVSSITYYDADNALQTLAASSYVVDTSSDPARVRLASGASWPEVYDRPQAIAVAYTAGYGATAASVPRSLRIAVMAAALSIYEHRDMDIDVALRANPAVENLVAGYRVWGVG